MSTPAQVIVADEIRQNHLTATGVTPARLAVRILDRLGREGWLVRHDPRSDQLVLMYAEQLERVLAARLETVGILATAEEHRELAAHLVTDVLAARPELNASGDVAAEQVVARTLGGSVSSMTVQRVVAALHLAGLLSEPGALAREAEQLAAASSGLDDRVALEQMRGGTSGDADTIVEVISGQERTEDAAAQEWQKDCCREVTQQIEPPTIQSIVAGMKARRPLASDIVADRAPSRADGSRRHWWIFSTQLRETLEHNQSLVGELARALEDLDELVDENGRLAESLQTASEREVALRNERLAIAPYRSIGELLADVRSVVFTSQHSLTAEGSVLTLRNGPAQRALMQLRQLGES